MSLVAYDSSDESSDNEESNNNAKGKSETVTEIVSQRTNDKLCLPTPKHDALVEKVNKNGVDSDIVTTDDSANRIYFDKLPKPKSSVAESESIVEDDDIPPKREIELKPEKPIKRDRVPVKITVPSLSEFKDLEEKNESKCNKIKPSDKGTKLFALLPPPKGAEVKSTNNLIPSVVNKTVTKINQEKVEVTKDAHKRDSDTSKETKIAATNASTKSSINISYDSNSEDDDEIDSNGSTVDFFALTAIETIPDSVESDSLSSSADLKHDSSKFDSEMKNNLNKDSNACNFLPDKTLVSNIMNLPKEEILLKNKAEVGPKLPIPEQEYNIDTEGNVAFDDKAIEYLCGKRGVKRKMKEIEEANIIEINGEDIKPDEREWLVKALTEEPIQRPVSMQGGGVNSQSKKKHQITYLAHQAKAMEMELKNQWAQNRLTRKQTQSKYGF